jgi:hypothetical protein
MLQESRGVEEYERLNRISGGALLWILWIFCLDAR